MHKDRVVLDDLLIYKRVVVDDRIGVVVQAFQGRQELHHGYFGICFCQLVSQNSLPYPEFLDELWASQIIWLVSDTCVSISNGLHYFMNRAF